MENLGHVGFLLTCHHRSVRGGQGSGFADSGLGTIPASSVLLPGNELHVVRGLCLAPDNGRKRGTGIPLVEKHTAIIQYAKTGCNYVSHNYLPPVNYSVPVWSASSWACRRV